jgi:hypothetical protein
MRTSTESSAIGMPRHRCLVAMTFLFERVDHDIDTRRALGQYRARAITGHSRAVFSVQLEGGRLYSSSFDNTVRVRHSRLVFAVTSTNADRFALITMGVIAVCRSGTLPQASCSRCLKATRAVSAASACRMAC